MAARRQLGSGLQGATLPTQRTQYSQHAVERVQSERTGMENIGNVMANFFGQASGALQNVQKEVMVGEQEKIRQENEAEKIQAVNDFHTGKLDESLTNDRDYMDTYRGMKATRIASDARRDFEEWYQTEWVGQNRYGDLSAARDEWVKSNLVGFDDEKLQALVLSGFYQDTDRTVDTHAENAYRWKVEEDLIELNTALYDDVSAGEMTPERVQWYINAARQIDQLNPNEAAPRVIAGLMASVRNNPSQTDQIIKVLDQPGTGINGRSFAESFPDAFANFQSGALQSYLQVNTKEEADFYRDIEEEINSASFLSDDQVADLTLRLMTGRAIYGGGNTADALKDKLGSMLQSQAQTMADVSKVGWMLDNQIVDAGHLRKHFMDYIGSVYGTDNLLEVEPAALAKVVSKMGSVVPETLKVQLSTALTNTADPEAQAQALAILSGIKATKGDEYVTAYLNNEASGYYEHISDKLETSTPIPQAIASVNEARSNGKLAENLDWRTVTQEKSVGEAEAKVDGWIDDAVQTYWDRNGLFTGPFKTDVQIPSTLMLTIRDKALKIVAERGDDNINPEDAVAEAVKGLMTNANIVGTREFPVLTLGSSLEGYSQGEDGIEDRVRLGYGIVAPNGQAVDTLQIYFDELENLGGFLVDNEDLDSVVIQEDPSRPGMFQLKGTDGDFMVFEGDEVITFNGTHYRFPGFDDIDNKEEVGKAREMLEQQFKDVIPKGFGFVPVPGGWKMMYRPHFGDADVSYDDLEAAYKAGDVSSVEDELSDYQFALVAAQRRAGLVPMTTGVNSNLPDPSNAQDILDYIENEMWRGVAQNGRRHVDRHRVQHDQTYRSRRQDMLVGAEALRTHAYDDETGKRVTNGSVSGKVTVGIGFNMDRSGARSTWNSVFGGAVSFDDVYSGKASLSKSQAQMLFDYDMRYFEGVVTSAADGRSLPENQHLALLGIAYNAPKRVADMSSDIANGNHSEVLRKMLYESFNPKHKLRRSLAARRYREARLYAGSDPMLISMLPDVQEYLDHWR